ncbi:hypothetical protein ACWD6L_21700 [Micromonospora profundi]|uniref:Uncharacterized protein n=1 Tax=Micromonospora profundi TaxID=1420889 RepID=A0AAJ6HZT6_9ACTN|nr:MULTISPECIES: hypothetical protein [Micromonospora]KOX04038.1 hypothetical protein ADK66_27790 [Micromonospora sp. NRRL B-16802]NJC16339.1 hypothetical protein [Micromonospora profundi]WLS47738.1 hypothetical protein Q3V37_11150 [Micromonospora profundi]
MASVADRAAASTPGAFPPLPRAVVQSFYRRMRAVAPAAVGAIERDRAADPEQAFADTACGRLVRSLDDAGLRALGMWTHHWCMRFYDDDTRPGRRLVREIAARPGLGWTADEVRWMLRESVWAGPAAPERFTLPRAAAAHLPPTDRPLDELPPGHWPEGVVPRQRRPS